MEITKSRLKQIIKEELSLLGSLDIEENFVKKHDIQINEERDVAWEETTKVLSIIRATAKRLNDNDAFNFHEYLKDWFCPEQKPMQEEE